MTSPGPSQTDAPKSESIDTSFVIIAHNASSSLPFTIRSIRAQQGLENYEVVVVDDGSEDGTGEVAQRCAADVPVHVVLLDRNVGRGAARSRGIAVARGNVIATVDADIVLPPHWLQRCREVLETSDAVSGISVPDGDVTYVYNRFGLVPRAAPSLADIAGSNALYRSSVFKKVAYDPRLRNGEDVALSHAMREAGLRVMSLAELLVEHREDKSFLESVAWLYESGVGSARQLARYGEWRVPDTAFAAWVMATAYGMWAASARRRSLAVFPSAVTVTAISWAHLRSKFLLRRSPARTVLAALAAHSVLIAAYLLGKGLGLPIAIATRAQK